MRRRFWSARRSKEAACRRPVTTHTAMPSAIAAAARIAAGLDLKNITTTYLTNRDTVG
jgi:hypothetical protein